MTSPRPIPAAAHARGFRGGRPAQTRARLLGWAHDVVGRGWCRPLEGNMTELTCSQADLARRLGYSPTSGGVSKRLAALESLGVVVARDPVVFDLTMLETLTGPRTEQGREPLTRPVPSGRLRVPDRADPPEAGGVPGTVDLAETVDPWASDVTVPEDVSSPDRLACAVRLLRQVCEAGRADLLDDVLVCLPHLLGDGARAELRAPRSSPVPQVLPDVLSSSPSSSRPDSRPVSLPSGSFPLLSTASLRVTPSAPFSPYPSPALPVSRAPVPVSSASSTERLRLLAPLLEDCRRLGLPGIGSPAGLLAALDRCTAEEVRLGVELIRRQLAGNVAIRSPVGLLAHLARSGELALLARFPQPAEGNGTTPPLVEHGPGRVPSEEDEATWLARIASLMGEHLEPPTAG